MEKLIRELKRYEHFNKTLNEFDDPLLKAFVTPFTDIVKSAASVEVPIAKIFSLAKSTLVGFLPTIFIPFLSFDYENYRKEEAEDFAKIEKKYEDVFTRNIQAAKSSDLFGLALLLSPKITLGVKLAQKAPMAALEILQVLTGGSPAIDKVRDWLKTGGTPKAGGWGFGGYGGNQGGGGELGGGMGGGGDYYGGDIGYDGGDMGGMYEAAGVPKPPGDFTRVFQQLMNDPETKQKLDNSNVLQNMRKDVLNTFVDHVGKFVALKTPEQMKQRMGQSWNALETKVKEQVAAQKMDDKQTQEFWREIIEGLHLQFKNEYIKKLAAFAQQDPTLKPLVQDTMARIKALK